MIEELLNSYSKVSGFISKDNIKNIIESIKEIIKDTGLIINENIFYTSNSIFIILTNKHGIEVKCRYNYLEKEFYISSNGFILISDINSLTYKLIYETFTYVPKELNTFLSLLEKIEEISLGGTMIKVKSLAIKDNSLIIIFDTEHTSYMTVDRFIDIINKKELEITKTINNEEVMSRYFNNI